MALAITWPLRRFDNAESRIAMIYLKSVAAGVAGSLLAVILLVILEALAFTIAASWQSRTTGSGGIAGVSSAMPVLIAAVAGFVAGFWWMFRKRSA
jgi:hypothetical protein